MNVRRTLLLSLLGLVLFAFAGASGCDKEKGLKITGIEPKSGPAIGAGVVTILGSGFSEAGKMGASVYFADDKANFLRFEGDDKLMVIPPPGTEGVTVDVLVVFGDGREHTFSKAYKYQNTKVGFDEAN